MEKRIICTIAALLTALGAAKAQESVYYFLPSTTITVEVEAEQETFFAGPYAAFAKKLLGIDVRRADEVTSRLISATITSSVEADRKSATPLDAEVPELMALSAQGLVSFGDKSELNATWRFLPQLKGDFTDKGLTGDSKKVKRVVYKTVPTDTSFVRIPVEETFTETKSLEDKAKEAADHILSLRAQRLDIATGNTDATFSGAALADALKEIRLMEEEYMAMFRGYSITRTISASFDVVPQANLKNQRYLAFRTDPDRGLVSNGRGTPYYVELEPEGLIREEAPASAKKAGKTTNIKYRIPMVCKLIFTEDGRPLVETRVPVYQLGKEATYPVKTN